MSFATLLFRFVKHSVFDVEYLAFPLGWVSGDGGLLFDVAVYVTGQLTPDAGISWQGYTVEMSGCYKVRGLVLRRENQCREIIYVTKQASYIIGKRTPDRDRTADWSFPPPRVAAHVRRL